MIKKIVSLQSYDMALWIVYLLYITNGFLLLRISVIHITNKEIIFVSCD